EYGIEMLLAFAGAMVAAGVVAGLIAGLRGVGGGIVLVPILFYLFTALDVHESIRMHMAVGTSLTTIVATALSSTRAHYKRGSIDTALLRSWGPWLFGGAVGGMALFSVIDSSVVALIFGVVALIIALYMLLSKEPAEETTDRFPKGPLRWLLGVVVGGVSSLMGIGGGTLSVPLLSLYKYPIRRAVGTAAAIGLLISIPGAIGAFVSGLGS